MGRKERKRITQNEQVRELLEKESLTDEEIQFIKQSYSGIGGLVRTGWDNGQFFTPENVTEFVIKMLGIEGGRILEPSCGSGGFFEHLPSTCDVVGIEIMSEASKVAQICYPKANILQEDALQVTFDEPFDYCIGNPPFGLKVDFDFASGGKFKSEVAFVEYGLRNLKDGGILGMVVPDSMLANKKETPFRKWAIENNRLLGVIGFPTQTFFHSGTSVKTSLLMIQKGRENPNEDYDVFFAVAEKIGWCTRGNPTDSDLDAIYHEYASWPQSHLNRRKRGVDPIVVPFQNPLDIIEMPEGQYALAL
ncbi:HsdM family class I SAM-dependent methyltransferase [Ammoniphilus resinae]|uniref:Type I restriction enzyme M protein n=1 Tax=Ammoniphilus resinae TaxID=861532 RepID=A0ABS4GNB2_9BACL|nr:N-6 DNA methylase [Ammoniphilus resinae]MBP1931766.1 type I restriction enzyme M protein [Ammoniphilus resinae]